MGRQGLVGTGSQLNADSLAACLLGLFASFECVERERRVEGGNQRSGAVAASGAQSPQRKFVEVLKATHRTRTQWTASQEF